MLTGKIGMQPILPVTVTVIRSKVPRVNAAVTETESFGVNEPFTLPDTDSDIDPGTDIHQTNGPFVMIIDLRSESESESIQWEHFLYSAM